MNFAQLKFVKEVYECHSFSKAAINCFVTQPTLSNGISNLEEELGEKIFKRTTRAISVTLFGEKLMSHIYEVLKHEQLILNQAENFTKKKLKTIKIGLSPLVNMGIINSFTIGFKKGVDDLDIVLIEENFLELNNLLDQEELDLIFVPIVNNKADKNGFVVYAEDLMLVDDQNQNKEIQLKEIQKRTFVMVPDSCGLSEITRSLLSSTSYKMKEYQGKAMSYQVLSEWATHGLGAAILPKSKLIKNSGQKILRSSKPVQIEFEIRWKNQEDKVVNKLVKFIKDNRGAF